MNIAMEQTEEYVNGQLKAKYGDTFIRGNNGKTNDMNLELPRACATAHCAPSWTVILAVLYISTQKKR